MLMPCGSYKNRCFWGTYRLHHQGVKKRRARNNVNSNERFLRNVCSYKNHTASHIAEDDILHSHRRENLKSYNARVVTCSRTSPEYPGLADFSLWTVLEITNHLSPVFYLYCKCIWFTARTAFAIKRQIHRNGTSDWLHECVVNISVVDAISELYTHVQPPSISFIFSLYYSIFLFLTAVFVCSMSFYFLFFFYVRISLLRPPLWSSGQSSWIQTQGSRARFPALPKSLNSSESGTGFTASWG
jgi:hypothetical protein